ncbi:MAG TPA: hypothetical protein VLA67_05550, partial [Nitrospiraceae bacterium]|nr:hypothetical protein [Nitrospiraceae bacterium]
MKQEMDVHSGSSDTRESVSLRARAVIEYLQKYGLVAITFMSFFPFLFRYQEYAFFVLLAM